MKTHFVTGATGFIGRYLVRALMKRGDVVWALVRPSGTQSAEERLRAIFPEYAKDSRLRACSGDILLEDLGISDMRKFGSASDCRITVWHLAANLSFFPEDQQDVRSTNETGTRNTLMFAERLHAAFIFVSTAFTCGTAQGIVREQLHDANTEFHNEYERSKWHAEKIVAEARAIPWIIFRPSIVIGDAYEGKAAGCTFGYYRFAYMFWVFRKWILVKLKQNGLLGWILRALRTRVDRDGDVVYLPWLILPCPTQSKIHLIPVDFVVDAMIHAACKETPPYGSSIHITHPAPPEFADVFQILLEDVGYRGVTCKKISRFWFRVVFGIFSFYAIPLKKYTRSARWYMPYIIEERSFETQILNEQIVRTPHAFTNDFFHRVNRYARDVIFRSIDPK